MHCTKTWSSLFILRKYSDPGTYMDSDWATFLYVKKFSIKRRKREWDTKIVNSNIFISNCFGELWLTNLAVEAPPACDAFLVACFITSVVPKFVISRTAELGAGRVEVMQVTLDPYPVRDACRIPVIIQCVPIRTRQNYTGICCLLDDTVRCCGKHKYREVTASYTVQKILPFKIPFFSTGATTHSGFVFCSPLAGL